MFLLFLAAGIALGGWYVAGIESEKRKIKAFLNSEMGEIAEVKRKESKFMEIVLRAGMAGQEANLVLIFIAATVGSYVFGYSLTGNSKLAVMFTALGPFLVWQYLQYRIDKNEWKMYSQVGDMCKLMANAVAGMSVERALPRIAEKLETPLKDYVVDMARMVTKGEPVVDVLKEFQKYIRVTPYFLFIRATAIGKKRGGDLAEAYADIYNVVNKSMNAMKKVRVVNNSAVRRGAIVTAIPVGMVMFLRGFSPDYIAPLFTTFIGYICLGFIGLLVVGA
ncbi:MAG: hypothetical protein K6U74_16660, partial [Firmicutes bacterium]|nr:hypothetical protein [Bacillota bacterium]